MKTEYSIIFATLFVRLASGQCTGLLSKLASSDETIRVSVPAQEVSACTQELIRQDPARFRMEVAPIIERAAVGPSEDVRIAAHGLIAMIAMFHSESAAFLEPLKPTIEKGFSDSAKRARANSLMAAGYMKPETPSSFAEKIVPLLSDTGVSHQAFGVLARIKPLPEPIERAMIGHVRRTTDMVSRGNLMSALGSMQDPRPITLEVLLDGASDDQSYLRERALAGIIQLGPRAASLAPKLMELAAQPGRDADSAKQLREAAERLPRTPR